LGSPAATTPLRVAIVGSGPAGAYTAAQLLDAGPAVEVHVFDRLPTPWGLVRSGVAPDHPKIKTVTRRFEQIAQRDGFRFVGNVEVGVDLSHSQLAAHYNAVVYAIGAPTDRRLGIPGEELPGSLGSGELVRWYNGHPDQTAEHVDFATRRAVVVGNGNVALDVARMLALTRGELASTDVADHFLWALASSRIEEIIVLGRRGPLQAAFTTPELRELGALSDAEVVVHPHELELDQHSQRLLDNAAIGAAAARNLELLRIYARGSRDGERKRIILRFRTAPVEILGPDRVTGIRVARTELGGSTQAAVVTAELPVESIPCGLVISSIGYRATPIWGVPFDEESATIYNDQGRVLHRVTGEPIPGLYTVGWAKRGPTGVIGTNKRCAQETVGLLLEDSYRGRLPTPAAQPAALFIKLERRGVTLVEYAGWRAIDEHECAVGRSQRRPRVKLVDRAELLRHAGAYQNGAEAPAVPNPGVASGRTCLDCPCGEHIVGADEDDLVEKARLHLAMSHPGRRYTRDEILFLASNGSM